MEGKQPFDTRNVSEGAQQEAFCQCLLGGLSYLCNVVHIELSSIQSILYDYSQHCTVIDITRLVGLNVIENSVGKSHVRTSTRAAATASKHASSTSATPTTTMAPSQGDAATRTSASTSNARLPEKMFKCQQFRLHPDELQPPKDLLTPKKKAASADGDNPKVPVEYWKRPRTSEDDAIEADVKEIEGEPQIPTGKLPLPRWKQLRTLQFMLVAFSGSLNSGAQVIALIGLEQRNDV